MRIIYIQNNKKRAVLEQNERFVLHLDAHNIFQYRLNTIPNITKRKWNYVYMGT